MGRKGNLLGALNVPGPKVCKDQVIDCDRMTRECLISCTDAEVSLSGRLTKNTRMLSVTPRIPVSLNLSPDYSLIFILS